MTDRANDRVVTECSLSAQEYKASAMLHANCIAGGFLPTLGTRFLSIVYRCIDEHPEAVLITESVDGRVVGFVAGTTGRASLRSILVRRPFRAIAALAPALASRTKLLGIWRVARYASRGDGSTRGWPTAELLSIAVAPEARGSGVAERLFRSLERELSARGIERFKVIVGSNLIPAQRFYTKMGCTEIARIRIHGGAESVVLARTAEGSQP